jgi:hypothetical protein
LAKLSQSLSNHKWMNSIWCESNQNAWFWCSSRIQSSR